MNSAVLSLGIFGRLAVFEATREEVLDRISIICETYNRCTEPPANPGNRPQQILASSVPAVLLELSSLLETLVLADSVRELYGHDLSYVNGLMLKQIYPQVGHRLLGWHYPQIFPEAANRLKERALAGLNVIPISHDDSKITDMEMLLNLPLQALTFAPMIFMLDRFAMNREFFLDYLDCAPSTDQMEEEGWRRLRAFVDRTLGSDWVAYRTAVDLSESWPEELATELSRARARACNRWIFKLALYAEFCAARRHGTVAVSNLSTGNYYHLLTAQDQAAVRLLGAVAKSYSMTLQQRLEEQGFVCLDLTLPPLLRLCMRGANTIGEVVDKAVELRSHPWFVSLRGHLAGLAAEERPEKLLRYLGRLHDHIERGISGVGKMSAASIGVSSAGSLSLSLSGIGKQLLAWRNPVVYVHHQISRSLGFHDSIGDIVRILGLGRDEIVSILPKMDFLRSSQPAAGH